jgi:hypothetical protein
MFEVYITTTIEGRKGLRVERVLGDIVNVREAKNQSIMFANLLGTICYVVQSTSKRQRQKVVYTAKPGGPPQPKVKRGKDGPKLKGYSNKGYRFEGRKPVKRRPQSLKNWQA